MQTNAELLRTLLDTTTDNIYVQNPCQVVNVSSDGNYVDVKMFINDEDEDCILYNVPVQRPETQRAYIFLGIKKGDSGTLRFFDRSTEGYLEGDYDYNSDERQHDVNDRCFQLGFVPKKEAFVYPDNLDIAIGMKNDSAIISFRENYMTKHTSIKIWCNGDIDIQCSGTGNKINIQNGTDKLGLLINELITTIEAIEINSSDFKLKTESITALTTVANKFKLFLDSVPISTT